MCVEMRIHPDEENKDDVCGESHSVDHKDGRDKDIDIFYTRE